MLWGKTNFSSIVFSFNAFVSAASGNDNNMFPVEYVKAMRKKLKKIIAVKMLVSFHYLCVFLLWNNAEIILKCLLCCNANWLVAKVSIKPPSIFQFSKAKIISENKNILKYEKLIGGFWLQLS